MYMKLKSVKTLEDIEQMEYKQARSYLLKVREMHPIKDLKEHWGVSNYVIYKKLFSKYDIPISPREARKNNKEIKEEKNLMKEDNSTNTNNSEFSLRYEGTRNKKELEELFQSFLGILAEGEYELVLLLQKK